jgi:hypothetical protein
MLDAGGDDPAEKAGYLFGTGIGRDVKVSRACTEGDVAQCSADEKTLKPGVVEVARKIIEDAGGVEPSHAGIISAARTALQPRLQPTW